jgi:DNA-3-methyladenine glycosylase I
MELMTTATYPGIVVSAKDGKPRCEWVEEYDKALLHYHDVEWGTPSHNPRLMFETLSLGVFQAGLGWLTVFRKRDAFRDAFDNFEPTKVAAMTGRDVTRLLKNEQIIRNRAKIEATVNNAIVATSPGHSLADIAWQFVATMPKAAKKPSSAPPKKSPPRSATSAHPDRWRNIRTQSPESEALSAELKSEGYKFVGPTSVYSFMQSIGIVNDHIQGCFRA